MIRKCGNISPHGMPRSLKHTWGRKICFDRKPENWGSRCTQDPKWRLGAVGYSPLKSFPKSILAGQSCQDERICINAKVCSRSSLSNFALTTTAHMKLSDC